jgi:hypothetical protein
MRSYISWLYISKDWQTVVVIELIKCLNLGLPQAGPLEGLDTLLVFSDTTSWNLSTYMSACLLTMPRLRHLEILSRGLAGRVVRVNADPARNQESISTVAIFTAEMPKNML